MRIQEIKNNSEIFNPLKKMIMKVDVHAVNFNVDKKLVDFVQERMSKLEKYYDKVVSSDVYLKVEKTSDKENKIVEMKIIVPGDDFLVKKQCKTFEEAVELSAESIERLLVKRKEKIKTHI
jgi:putative sigma-54 modulation protein